MGKSFTDRSAGRIADSVRYTEAEQRNLAGRPRPNAMVPFELCRFEMQAELALPQNGPGTSFAMRMRWEPTQTHIGANYDTLSRAIPTLRQYGWQSDSGTNRYPWAADYWTGDYSTVYGDDNHLEPITVFDGMRNHSKMETRGDDVGAYGIAWKPHDGPARLEGNNEGREVTFWEIISMQTPGPFYGKIVGGLGYEDPYVTVEVLDQPVIFGGTAGHHRTLRGYDPFGDGWADYYGGLTTVAYNPVSTLGTIGTYCFAGYENNVVYCEWHMRLSRYVIRWVEPSDVGYSSFVCDGNTIKVPPWVTGSPS